MKVKKTWLGILVIVLLFGMIVVGCDVTVYDNSASLHIKNTSSIPYYVRKSDQNNWTTLQPDRTTFWNVFWNEGETGNITIHYQSDGTSATNWITRSYVLEKNERRNIDIPNAPYF